MLIPLSIKYDIIMRSWYSGVVSIVCWPPAIDAGQETSAEQITGAGQMEGTEQMAGARQMAGAGQIDAPTDSVQTGKTL